MRRVTGSSNFFHFLGHPQVASRENHPKSSGGAKGKVTLLIFTSMILSTLCPEDLYRSSAAAWKIAPVKVDGSATPPLPDDVKLGI